MITAYQTVTKPLSGSKYPEVYRRAFFIYKQIASGTKRRPYVRSKYFNKEKVFLDYFWNHIRQKNLRDRTRRLRFYPCALDLIRNGRTSPVSGKETNKGGEIFYRFSGITKGKEEFYVQIKEDVSRREKHFISVFPG